MPTKEGITICTGFEGSRFMPQQNNKDPRDTFWATWRETETDFDRDYRLIKEHGILQVRECIPWQRVQRNNSTEWDWSFVDMMMNVAQKHALQMVWDPIHHVSIPNYLYRQNGFASSNFPQYAAEYVYRFVDRYSPYVSQITLINEPYATTVLAGLTGDWFPFQKSEENFYPMMINVAKAVCLATEAARMARPDVRVVHTDSLEIYRPSSDTPENERQHMQRINVRRFICDDLIAGAVNERHPLFESLVKQGGFSDVEREFFEEHKVLLDERGCDYYISHEGYDYDGPRPWANKEALGPAAAIEEYRQHYHQILPADKQPEFSITETNILGYDTDRTTWLKFVLDQAVKAGVNKVYWYPFLDPTGWSRGRRMLREQTRRTDPVGVLIADDYSQKEGRVENNFSKTLKSVATGLLGIAEMPAYYFRDDRRTAVQPYYQPLMQGEGWEWQEYNEG